jgi:pimeloyl-ACP methyl ester carboxylesterase
MSFIYYLAMDEKAPLLRPLVRRESGKLRFELPLALLAIAALVTFGVVVHKSPNPRQDVYSIDIDIQTREFSWGDITPSKTLEWHDCFDSGYDCARLQVPMDWLEPDSGQTVVLAISRLRATDNEDYRGPVFFNPGGPGGSGIWALRDHGSQLQAIVGRNFDVVTFDPRGIGASVPRIECWDSAQKRQNWAMQETLTIDSHPGVLYDAWARAAAFSGACERSHNGTGLLRHVGTASHARDLLEVMEQAGQDKLQYWGFSYGTVLGGTFAAMYPDRVGRLVSDGNVDYEEWFNSRHVNSVRDADEVMAAFYRLCHEAGPRRCAFHGPSPDDIRRRHEAVLDQLRVRPVIYHVPEAGSATLPEIITYSKIRQLAATSLYRPNHYFTHLAEVLAGLERGDGEAYYDLVTRHGGSPFAKDVCSSTRTPPSEPLPLASAGEATDDAFPVILCADGRPLPQTAAEFEGFVGEMERVSRSTGAIVAKERVACAGRAVRPRWTFGGPFEARTGFPILFVANVADNITPLISARNNSAGFEGSVVLVQKSYGVSTFFFF